jgi:hypothetical protein
MNMRSKVQALQDTLSRAAKQSLTRRFGALYDKVFNAFIRERLRIFLKRKYSDPTRGCRRVQGHLLVRLGLFQFA